MKTVLCNPCNGIDEHKKEVNQQDCHSFIGSTGVMNFTHIGNGVCVFINPPQSGVTAHITQVTFSNMSCAPTSIEAKSLSCMEGSLTKSEKVVTRDLGCLETHFPCCKVMVGKDMTVVGGYDVAVLALNGYSNLGGPIEEAIILPPGTNRIFKFEALAKEAGAAVSVTIHWREEPIEEY